MRRRLWALFDGGLSIVLGVLWRFAPLHLPAFARKYGGSLLYAGMLYWLVVALAPRMRVWGVAVWALGLAWGVEAFKLVHWGALDAFRITLAGKLMLGRVFTLGALVAYAVGVLVVAGVDRVWGPGTGKIGSV